MPAQDVTVALTISRTDVHALHMPVGEVFLLYKHVCRQLIVVEFMLQVKSTIVDQPADWLAEAACCRHCLATLSI